MTLLVRCDGCLKLYTVGAEHVGRRFRCRACGRVQRAEVQAAPEPAPIVDEPAEATAPSRRAFRDGAGGPSRVGREGVLLVLASMADLFVTYALLRRSPRFYESNPVAQWFFLRWNIAGMALFKFGVIGAVIAIGEVVERRRPGWGRAVLWIGCLAALYAIYCGLRLLLGPAGVEAVGSD